MVFCRLLLRVFVLFLVSLAGLSPSWLPLFLCGRCSESEDSVYLNLGIQHSNSLSVISCLFLCILSSCQDKMHGTLSLTVCTCTPCQRVSFNSTTDSFSFGHDPYTLACKARPSFDRCGTSLSVIVIVIVNWKGYPYIAASQFDRFCWPSVDGPKRRRNLINGAMP